MKFLTFLVFAMVIVPAAVFSFSILFSILLGSIECNSVETLLPPRHANTTSRERKYHLENTFVDVSGTDVSIADMCDFCKEPVLERNDGVPITLLYPL